MTRPTKICPSGIRFVRRLRGGSQSSLIEANDGFQYIVKWRHNPQGLHVVRNEALGTGLYRALGLPVPYWTPIEISQDFIDGNIDMWHFAPAGKLRRPVAGLQFGSRRLGQPGQIPLEILPGNAYKRIKNRSDFWGALVVDIWAEHLDKRQAIFVQTDNHPLLDAVFIDQGHMFGGPDGADSAYKQPRYYLDRRVYEEEGSEGELETWIERIEKEGKTSWLATVRNLPRQWGDATVVQVGMRILNRIPQLREILRLQLIGRDLNLKAESEGGDEGRLNTRPNPCAAAASRIFSVNAGQL